GRTRSGRKGGRLPSLRRLQSRRRAVPLVDAAPAHDAERLQRVARLRDRRLGARRRLRTSVSELCALRRAARPRSRAVGAGAAGTKGTASAQGSLPARQPAPLQPEVPAELATPLRRL